jgi:hypothetical protein
MLGCRKECRRSMEEASAEEKMRVATAAQVDQAELMAA